MITVLRLGHRAGRDPRISTHCALVARAFGAGAMLYSGEHDSDLEKSVRDLVKNWGGAFEIEHTKKQIKTIKDFKGKNFKVCHLTVYGHPVHNVIKKLRYFKNILIIIGGEKVPSEIYKLADFNISITQQPHSEVAALAILLHEYFQGKELKKEFAEAKIKVIPSKNKKIVKKSK